MSDTAHAPSRVGAEGRRGRGVRPLPPSLMFLVGLKFSRGGGVGGDRGMELSLKPWGEFR